MSDRIVIDNGTLREIASSKGAHLENLGDGRWYLAFHHGDGSETVVRFTSRDLIGINTTPNIKKREPRMKLTKSMIAFLRKVRDHEVYIAMHYSRYRGAYQQIYGGKATLKKATSLGLIEPIGVASIGRRAFAELTDAGRRALQEVHD